MADILFTALSTVAFASWAIIVGPRAIDAFLDWQEGREEKRTHYLEALRWRHHAAQQKR